MQALTTSFLLVGERMLRNSSVTFQMVMPPRDCIAPPGPCKEYSTMRSYPGLKRLRSDIFFTVRMTPSQKGRLCLSC